MTDLPSDTDIAWGRFPGPYPWTTDSDHRRTPEQQDTGQRLSARCLETES